MINNVKIGAVTYKVSEEQDLHRFDNEWKKEFLNGHILFQSAELKVNAEAAPDVKVAVLWHEIVHGILNAAGYDEHQEQHVTALGYGLVQVIRDNPELIMFTTQKAHTDG